MYAIKEITEEQVLCWDYKQTKTNIIHPDFMVDNKEITDQFVQNLKRTSNKVQNLTGVMKKSFKKQRLETNILPQIHKISRITDSYGITTYLGRKFNNNEVPLEQCWIRENLSSVNQISTSN